MHVRDCCDWRMFCCAKCRVMVLDYRSARATALPRIAGQPAAAFRAFRQGGAIPAAAERLDQEYGTGHPAAENVDCGHFISEGCTLCGGHFQITGYAASITSKGQLQIFLGSENCTLLCVCFLFENTKCRQVVFDLLKASQDCFAVVGDGLVVGSDGLIGIGSATTRICTSGCKGI